MPDDDPPPAGILQSFRRLCDTGVTLLHNRVQLFAVEAQEQKARLIKVLLLAAVTVFLGNLALLLLTATIVVLAGEGRRVLALAGLCVIYLLAAAGAFFALRKELRSAPPPFSGTLGELRKDQEWLSGRK
jgi:uncharacterized membrane protein YqjE